LVNRTDRLLAIVLEMQARGAARAQDLADHFETSKRTIYRDIEALCEAGVPVVATPGRGYALMEGYFLPPLSFGVDEAMTLLLGADFVAQHFDPQYRTAAGTARSKIEAVLPSRHRPELDDLRESLHIIVAEVQQSPTPEVQAILGRLRRAIRERRTVRFRYHARHSAAGDTPLVERHADPYSLAHTGGAWYLLAHCHERGDVRMFRLDRIERLDLTDATYVRPEGFRLRPSEQLHERTMTVRVRFAEAAARWVRESRFFFVTDQEETPEGLLVTLRVRREDDVLAWLLGWGQQAYVLEPESLRRRLRDEAEAIARNYQEAAALLT
jgi:predicted DNA-binding transcriptional regulator YafY